MYPTRLTELVLSDCVSSNESDRIGSDRKRFQLRMNRIKTTKIVAREDNVLGGNSLFGIMLVSAKAYYVNK